MKEVKRYGKKEAQRCPGKRKLAGILATLVSSCVTSDLPYLSQAFVSSCLK